MSIQESRQTRTVRHFSLYAVVALIIGAISLYAFISLAGGVVTNEGLAESDKQIADTIHAAAMPTGITLFTNISLLGNEAVWVISAAVLLYFGLRRQWATVLLWIFTVGIGQLLNIVLKLTFNRARPVFSNAFVNAVGFSFPSGHAMWSAITYSLLAYILIIHTASLARRILIVTVCVLIVLLVGLSRIYLGAHYLSDVLAGFAAGALWVVISTAAFRLARRAANREVQPAAMSVTNSARG